MYLNVYLILISINIFYFTFGRNNINTYNVQHYCHYSVLNNKIHLNEDQPSIIVCPSRGSYSSSLDCQMRIIVTQNFAIIINLSYINLRNHYKFKDYLSIQFNESNAKLWFNNKLLTKIQGSKVYTHLFLNRMML
jgi:hypothetical protein